MQPNKILFHAMCCILLWARLCAGGWRSSGEKQGERLVKWLGYNLLSTVGGEYRGIMCSGEWGVIRADFRAEVRPQ